MKAQVDSSWNPSGKVVVGVEDLADVCLGVQAGRVAAEPAPGSADLSEGH